jgi:outer membrane protein assembly factor BamB
MARWSILVSFVVVLPLQADDWPKWFGPKGDGIWRETGLLEKFPEGGPKRLWSTKIGAGYSGPSVAGGLVYLMDRETEETSVRPSNKLTTIPGTERVLCLDEKTGKEVWKHVYASKYEKVSYGFGPRTTPVVVGDRVYALGTMGHLFCLDAKTGKEIWAKDFRKEYSAPIPVWGWSSHPMIDGDKLYCLVGGDKRCVMCFDRHTGKELWNALTTDEIGYAPLVIIEAGGKRQLIVWHSESINALNPDTGDKYWTQKYPVDAAPQRPAAPIATPRLVGDLLLISSFYHGPIALKLDAKEPKATVAWRPKTDDFRKVDGITSLMSTPAIKDGHIYGICREGELMCCKLDTGEKVWVSKEVQQGKGKMFGTTFLVQNENRFFLFGDNGDLIIADLSPKGYKELSRANVIKPTQPNSGRDVVWSHPAFANKCVIVRSDHEIVSVSLAQ